MQTPTEAEVHAWVMHFLQFASGAGAVFGITLLVGPDAAKEAFGAIQQIADGLNQTIGGSYKLIGILGPAIGLIVARLAGLAAKAAHR